MERARRPDGMSEKNYFVQDSKTINTTSPSQHQDALTHSHTHTRARAWTDEVDDDVDDE